MGGNLLVYPDVDDERVIQIFNQLRQKPIWGYGYFVNLAAVRHKASAFTSSMASGNSEDYL